MPPSRQGVGQRQPQREEEEDVHQHLPVKLRLLPRGRKRGEGGEDGGVGPGCAGEEGGVEDDEGCGKQQKRVCKPPSPPVSMCAQISP